MDTRSDYCAQCGTWVKENTGEYDDGFAFCDTGCQEMFPTAIFSTEE